MLFVAVLSASLPKFRKSPQPSRSLPKLLKNSRYLRGPPGKPPGTGDLRGNLPKRQKTCQKAQTKQNKQKRQQLQTTPKSEEVGRSRPTSANVGQSRPNTHRSAREDNFGAFRHLCAGVVIIGPAFAFLCRGRNSRPRFGTNPPSAKNIQVDCITAQRSMETLAIARIHHPPRALK